MTNIQKFIDDAENGGCNGYQMSGDIWCGIKAHGKDAAPYSIFLSPKAWKAVGKTRGWEDGAEIDMFNMFSALVFEGLSIEEALGKIL